VLTRVGKALIKLDVASKAIVTRDAVAIEAAIGVDTDAVDARLLAALINVQLTVESVETVDTGTRVVGQLIQAGASIQARFAEAVVDPRGTIGALEAGRTHALVRRDLVLANHSCRTRVMKAFVDVVFTSQA